MEHLAFRQRVADGEVAVVGDADNVAGEGFFRQFALAGEEQDRVVERERFSERTCSTFMPRV